MYINNFFIMEANHAIYNESSEVISQRRKDRKHHADGQNGQKYDSLPPFNSIKTYPWKHNSRTSNRNANLRRKRGCREGTYIHRVERWNPLWGGWRPVKRRIEFQAAVVGSLAGVRPGEAVTSGLPRSESSQILPGVAVSLGASVSGCSSCHFR